MSALKIAAAHSAIGALIGVAVTTYIHRNDVEIGEGRGYINAYNAISEVIDGAQIRDQKAWQRYKGMNIALTAVVYQRGGLPAPSFYGEDLGGVGR